MRQAELDALVDLVREEKDSLAHIRDWKISEEVISRMVKEGDSPSEILVRAAESRFADDLLAKIVKMLAPTERRGALLRAIVTLPDKHWRGTWEYKGYWGFSADAVEALMTDAETFEWILKERPGLLTYEKHPLHSALDANAYWLKRVRWYIVRKDFLRAFEELKKANRGLYIGETRPSFRDRDWECNFTFAASDDVIRALVRELYDAMVGKGVIQHLPEGSFTLRREQAFIRIRRYQTRLPRDGRRPSVCEVEVPVAGKDIADIFLIETKKGHIPGHWGEQTLEWVYEREGGMVLAIAEWWRQKRNAKRDANKRRKHEQALAEYERQRRSTV